LLPQYNYLSFTNQLNKNHSSQPCANSFIINTSSSNTNINFVEWLVGLTEGDGTFTIGQQERSGRNYYYCIFKVSQSAYNLQMLEYLLSVLKCGGIYRFFKA